MGMDCTFDSSEPIVFKSKVELRDWYLKVGWNRIWSAYEIENAGEYVDEFEGDRCDNIRIAIETFYSKNINGECVNLSENCLSFVIAEINKCEPRLGWFISKDQMMRVLSDLKDVVKNGGLVTFDCWY